MDYTEPDEFQRFVRTDMAGVATLLLIGALVSGLLYDITYGLGLATLAFCLVGVTTAWQWRCVLKEQEKVELLPFQSLLAGAVVIALLQLLFGLFSFNFDFLHAVFYAVISAAGYAFIIMFVSYYNLPGENYKVRSDPRTDTTTKYVFEEYYYISLVEQEALKKSETNSNTQ